MLKLNKKTSSQIIFDCLFVYLIILIVGIVLFNIIIKCFGTPTTDIPSILANVFVWSATLMAPLVVLLLANAWKVEYQKNLVKEISIDLIKNLIRSKHVTLEIDNFIDLAKSHPKDIEFNEVFLQKECDKNQNEYNLLWREINKDSEIFATIIKLNSRKLFNNTEKDSINDYYQQVINHFIHIQNSISNKDFHHFIESTQFHEASQNLAIKRKKFLEVIDTKIQVVNSHINLDID